jgi:hypothetical protein
MATTTDKASHPRCCIGLTPDSLDGIFKKITTPWRRCRLFRRPNLGFSPAIEVR